MAIQCDGASGSELLEIDPNQIQTLNDEMREDLEKRCRVMHITQIRQATMVRIEFQKSLRVQSSGVRMLDRDPYKLAIKYEVNLENPPQGLRLRHWNGGFSEYTVEKALCPNENKAELELEFSAKDENGEEIRDSEAHVEMRTQVVDEEGTVYAQIDWNTVINDIFD